MFRIPCCVLFVFSLPLCRVPQQEQSGLHYAIGTRIVELVGRPSVLQVEVLYGRTRHDMSRNLPGWREGMETSIQPGGRRIKLDVRMPYLTISI